MLVGEGGKVDGGGGGSFVLDGWAGSLVGEELCVCSVGESAQPSSPRLCVYLSLAGATSGSTNLAATIGGGGRRVGVSVALDRAELLVAIGDWNEAIRGFRAILLTLDGQKVRCMHPFGPPCSCFSPDILSSAPHRRAVD
jgi:hypothetical protein